MQVMEKGKEGLFVTAAQAGRMLRVSPITIKNWVKRGIIPGEIHTKMVVREILKIPVEAVQDRKKIRTVRCVKCNRKFQVQRLRKVNFCCELHRWQYHADQRKLALLETAQPTPPPAAKVVKVKKEPPAPLK
ncbi:MAG: hypothetical protein A2340_04805 [Lentisphaerae bacterium RIFOXYB12_FULL_60_10]|nr:MAG: hypothetical protein A2340_04805 [Lentisphaerae bacterium RIFOXYB12_FULL_60_10]